MGRVVAFGVALVIPLWASSEQPLAPHPGTIGPYAVGHTQTLVVDTSRDQTSTFTGRPVPISVWYPVDASSLTVDSPRAVYPLDPIYGKWPTSTSSDWELVGIPPAYEGAPVAADKPFPLVVFSPGRSGRYFGYIFNALRLASHGFVVAVTQHYHDGAYAWDPQEALDRALFNRPRDVSAMMDTLLAENDNSGSVLYNSVRPDQIAASGHSLGGYAALALAAGDDDVCATNLEALPVECNSLGRTFADPRIKAIVLYDASNQYLHFSELARITVTSLGVGQASENHGNTANAGVGAWQARQHAAITGHPNYRADVRDAVHSSFGNSCTAPHVLYSKNLITPAQLAAQLAQPQCVEPALNQPEVLRLAAQYAVAFLKTHLAGEHGHQNMLTPGWALAREDHIEFFVTEPRNPTALAEDPATFLYFPHQSGSQTARAHKDLAPPENIER